MVALGSIKEPSNVLYGLGNPGAAALEGNPLTIIDDRTQASYRIVALVCAVACFGMATIALGVL